MLCNTTSSQTSRFNTTKMVFIVTALFFSCNAFSPILSVWEACQPDLFDQSSSNNINDRTKSSFIEGLSFRLDTDEQSTSTVTKNISKNDIEDNNLSNKTIGGFLLVDLSNLGVLLNASTNFIIYLIYCRRYRRYFKGYLAMFRCFQYKNKFRENAAKSNSWPSEYGATKRRFKKQLNSENKPMSRVCPSLATTNGRVIKPRTVAFDKKIAVLRQSKIIEQTVHGNIIMAGFIVKQVVGNKLTNVKGKEDYL
uniref:Uncharacterized protein n=1 Tax=Romanomermis culicivorax TaxID=13658 RepID=A0A915KFK4_ROMCU